MIAALTMAEVEGAERSAAAATPGPMDVRSYTKLLYGTSASCGQSRAVAEYRSVFEGLAYLGALVPRLCATVRAMATERDEIVDSMVRILSSNSCDHHVEEARGEAFDAFYAKEKSLGCLRCACAERDAMRAELAKVMAERDDERFLAKASADGNHALYERADKKRLIAVEERDVARVELVKATAERDVAKAVALSAVDEQNKALERVESVERERDVARAERDAAIARADKSEAERGAVIDALGVGEDIDVGRDLVDAARSVAQNARALTDLLLRAALPKKASFLCAAKMPHKNSRGRPGENTSSVPSRATPPVSVATGVIAVGALIAVYTAQARRIHRRGILG